MQALAFLKQLLIYVFRLQSGGCPVVNKKSARCIGGDESKGMSSDFLNSRESGAKVPLFKQFLVFVPVLILSEDSNEMGFSIQLANSINCVGATSSRAALAGHR